MTRLLIAAVVVFAALSFTARADALPFLPSPCDLAPSGPAQDACKAATDPVGTAAGIVGGAVGGSVGQAISGGIFDQAVSWLANFMADAIKAALDGLGQLLGDAPKPPVDQAWFAQQYFIIAPVGVLLGFWWFLTLTTVNMFRFRINEMARNFVMFILSVFLTMTAPLLIRMGLSFADTLTTVFTGIGGQSAGTVVDRVTAITASIKTNSDLGTIAQPFLLIGFLLAAVLLVMFWFVMLAVRSEIVLLGTLAIPFVLPSIIDGTARFAKFYAKALFGVILSAPILWGTVCVGAWLMTQTNMPATGVWPLVSAVVLMGAAIGLPWVVLKMLLPMVTPVVVAIERGGHRAVEFTRDRVTQLAAFAGAGATGGASLAAVDMASPSRPTTPPPQVPVAA